MAISSSPPPVTPQQDAEDVRFMRAALELARQGRDAGEVPVGALVVCGGEAGQLPAGGLHALCDDGAVRDVRGSDPAFKGGAGRVWREGIQDRGAWQHHRRVHRAAPELPLRHRRRGAGGRVRGDDFGVLRVAPTAEEGDGAMSELFVEVDMRLQQLYLWEPFPDGDLLIRQYPVSTATNRAGEQNGSYRTPRGRHRIADKIGAGAQLCAALKSREPTGEIWTPELDAENPGRDWILTRILWLDGLEPGKNK